MYLVDTLHDFEHPLDELASYLLLQLDACNPPGDTKKKTFYNL